ncbi:unnamed protein product [Bursaphelenchus xylophilus]|nr:unnamed protein product [Bursaphelenchus xylophilus]CAG9092561.1 unnamed protein product [Bursaphelenchus xylophilus]
MICKLYHSIPRPSAERHHVDAFTGRDAANALERVLMEVFPERQVKRVNALRVLQKLVEDSVIESDDCKRSMAFLDHSTVFYKFTSYGLEKHMPEALEAFKKMDSEGEKSRKRRRSGSTAARTFSQIREKCRRFMSTDRTPKNKENVSPDSQIQLLSSKCITPQIDRFRPYMNGRVQPLNQTIGTPHISKFSEAKRRSRRDIFDNGTVEGLSSLSLTDRAKSFCTKPNQAINRETKSLGNYLGRRKASFGSTERLFDRLKRIF